MFKKEEYVGTKNNKEYLWKCLICGSIFSSSIGSTKFHEFSSFVRCKKCYPIIGTTSIKEQELLKFCKHYFPNAQRSNKNQLISGFSLDIVISEIHLAIEFNGNYWHSTKAWLRKHNSLDEYFNRHLSKTLACNAKGYRLIHIWEDEWDADAAGIKEKLMKIFKGEEDLYFTDSMITLDRSWYNGVSIPGYEISEEQPPIIRRRGEFDVEDCGSTVFKTSI